MEPNTIDKTDLVTIRAMTLPDKNFILATYLRGLYYGKSWYSLIPKDVFMRSYHSILTSLIESRLVDVKVACLKDDPEIILGYSVLSSDHNTLHWVFTKKSWRSIGIAKSLVPKSIKSTTHVTKVGLSIMETHPGVEFNPFLIPIT